MTLDLVLSHVGKGALAEFDTGQVDVDELLERLGGFGSLESNEAVPVQSLPFDFFALPLGELLADELLVLLDPSGVGDDVERVVAFLLGDDRVVDDPPEVIEDDAQSRGERRETRQRRGSEGEEKILCARSLEGVLEHVGDVEQAGSGTDVVVRSRLPDRAVGQGHRVPGKGDHLGLFADIVLVQWSFEQLSHQRTELGSGQTWRTSCRLLGVEAKVRKGAEGTRATRPARGERAITRAERENMRREGWKVG